MSSSMPSFNRERPLDLADETEGKKALKRTEFIITFVWKERTVDERFKTNFANDFRNGLDELLSRSCFPKHGQKFRDITLMDSRFDSYHF